MKTIGLLGGMSWESTAIYYKILNQEIRKISGGLNSAKIAMQSVNFAPLEVLMKQGDWAQILKILTQNAKIIEHTGADFLVIASNTMHKFFLALEKELSIGLLHIADACAENLLQKKIKKIGLLGTKFTMQEDFYKKRLLEFFGITTLIPNEKIQTIQNKIIFNELCLGKITKKSKEIYLQSIAAFSQQGAEAVILGCTEIGLLIKQKHTPMLLLDSASIHAKKAAQLALK